MIDLAEVSDGLVEIEPGLWQGASEGRISYPPGAHDACLELEAGSYWFEHRNACILAAVRRFPPQGVLFDVGGGNGYVAQGLVDAGFETVVVEPRASGARNARRRGLEPVVCATLEAAFRPGALPAVGLFDVLEHVDDDLGFLRRIGERLVPHGRLYVTVPALTWLWSPQDEQAGHVRRYSRRGLVDALTRTGFEVEAASSFFAPLILPILLFRVLPGRLRLGKPLSYEREYREAGGRILHWALRREPAALVDRGRRLGSSLLAVATRR